jgi:hypothetical protein
MSLFDAAAAAISAKGAGLSEGRIAAVHEISHIKRK